MFIVNNLSIYSHLNIDRTMNEHTISIQYTQSKCEMISNSRHNYTIVSQMDYNTTLSIKCCFMIHITSFIHSETIQSQSQSQSQTTWVIDDRIVHTLFKCFWLWSNCVQQYQTSTHSLIDWFQDFISLSHRITSHHNHTVCMNEYIECWF
jgi:hypothetical protein